MHYQYLYIVRLFELGHFFNPNNPNGHNVKREDLRNLTFNDAVVKAALASFQEMGEPILKMKRGAITGDLDEPTISLFDAPRCGHPDYTLNEKVGSGSWPMPCQKEGVKIYYDKSRMPSVLNSRWATIQSEMFAAYSEIGCKLIEVPAKSGSNIYVSWTSFFGSTIGLSSFNNEDCSDSASQQLGINYTDLMFELHTHETGHNMNLGHTRGGIMNPFILAVNPHKWNKDDPSYNTLVRYFGGEPIGPPVPGPVDVQLKLISSIPNIDRVEIDFAKNELRTYMLSKQTDTYALMNNKVI